MLIPKKITGLKRVALISFLLLMTFTIIFVIYNHFFREDWAIRRAQQYRVNSAEIFQAPNIDSEVNINILTTKPYSDLKQHGSLPVKPGRAGRDNPFERIIFAP